MLELITSFAPEGASGAALWLPLVWATLLAIAVAMYVVADGFDLGVGILFNAAGSENWRDRMSVAPIWDGNETWLILGGGGLLAVFYLAYAILLPALYYPALRHAHRADLPRRGVRVPLQGRHLQADLGLCVPLRLPRRHLRAGRGARGVRAGLPRRGAQSRAALSTG